MNPQNLTPTSVPEASSGPSWQRAFEDLGREHDFETLEIEGKIPDDLDLCGLAFESLAAGLRARLSVGRIRAS